MPEVLAQKTGVIMQQTSLLAWIDVQTNLGDRQKAVFDVLKSRGPMNNLEISQVVGIPINSITPRVKELRERGFVEEHTKARCKTTGRLVIYWRARV